MVKLTGIFIYPVKSARGIALANAELSDRGLTHDRRFMIVDDQGLFVTQRQEPALARLETALEGDALALSFEGQTVRVPLAPPDGAARRVCVFSDEVEARDLGPDARAFLSAALAQPLSLVYMPAESRRAVDPKRAGPDEVVSFADGFPYLLANETSLEALNGALEHPVPMARFRPNFVIAGAPAYAEDSFGELTIGEVPFVALKPCSRCVIIDTDQQRGVRAPGPLEALARTHKIGNRAIFGQNLVARGRGTVRVGDPVRI